jgi:hypothetical protein
MPLPLDLHFCKCPQRVASPAHRGGRPQEFPCQLILTALLFCVICTSCGAVGSAPPPPVTVSVSPNSAQPFPGANVQFKAEVENSQSIAINWQVNQMAGGNATVGIISSSGNYTAPASVPNPPTVTVTAVLQSDATKSGSAIVTIQGLSAIQGPLTLSPKLSSVTTSQSVQFNVLTAGVANSDVNWGVDGISNGNATVGTISSSGNYSPPPSAGSHLITAILQANSAAIGTAEVEVTTFPGTLTWRNDNTRSGANSQELALAPETVSSSTFGKLFSCPIDGYAYAQPLYVPNLAIPTDGMRMHNVIFVATEKDSVFAFDADANPCELLWKQTNLIPAGSQAIETPNLQIASTDIVPFVGITGTPVISASNSLLYVVVATQTVAVNPTYNHHLFALDLATGTPEIQPAGADIATPPGQANVFSSMIQNQRAALLMDNGTIYVAFGSYGGLGNGYHGWLFGYDSGSLQQTSVFNVTPGTIQGGIWQSGGGPSADSNHNVFVSTGDGKFNAGQPGLSLSYSNSFLQLGTTAGLTVFNYFTPCDEGTGQILGTGAPILLPNLLDSPLEPHLLIGGSKGVTSGGSLYVVNRDNMGGFLPNPCPDASTRVQTIQVGGPVLSTPLFWNGSVYVAPGNGNLVSLPLTQGTLSATPASQSPETLGPQGATPVLSWNGSVNGRGNAILWLIDSSGALATPNTAAILRAYDPNNLSNEIYNSAMAAASRDQAGPAVKFTIPTVANGKVYVGTQTELDAYGLLP